MIEYLKYASITIKYFMIKYRELNYATKIEIYLIFFR